MDTRRTDEGAVVCSIAGDLDLSVLAPVRVALETAIASRPPVLVVDMANVEFCDSSGLSLLLQIRLDAQAAGVPMHLAALSAPVARVFEITGTSAVFTIYRSAEEAGRV
jgi:anti-anti-sigma factor